MSEGRIGIRELKSKLSKCVREVKEGRTDEACRTRARAAHGRGSGRRESRVIAYFDAGALVKRHVDERGSRETLEFAARAEVVATVLVSQAEVAAAPAKAVRAKLVDEDEAREAQRAFAGQCRISPEFR